MFILGFNKKRRKVSNLVSNIQKKKRKLEARKKSTDKGTKRSDCIEEKDKTLKKRKRKNTECDEAATLAQKVIDSSSKCEDFSTQNKSEEPSKRKLKRSTKSTEPALSRTLRKRDVKVISVDKRPVKTERKVTRQSKRKSTSTDDPMKLKPYLCVICDRRYAWVKDLRRHVRTYHPEAVQVLECCDSPRKSLTRDVRRSKITSTATQPGPLFCSPVKEEPQESEATLPGKFCLSYDVIMLFAKQANCQT